MTEVFVLFWANATPAQQPHQSAVAPGSPQTPAETRGGATPFPPPGTVYNTPSGLKVGTGGPLGVPLPQPTGPGVGYVAPGHEWGH